MRYGYSRLIIKFGRLTWEMEFVLSINMVTVGGFLPIFKIIRI